MPESYLRFARHELGGRKTPIVYVCSKRTGAALGQIRWYGPWRQFCFYPEPATIFNKGCMVEIQNQIGLLHEERGR